MEVSVDDFDWQLDWLVAHREVVDLETAVRRWGEPESSNLVVLTFDDGYRNTFEAVFPRLVEKALPFVLYLATESIDKAPTFKSEGFDEPLSWTQAEQMMNSGLMTVGAHTHTHCDLRSVSSSVAEREIGACNALIEKRLGVFPRHFAYPWGYWSAIADPLVQKTYSTAVLGATPRPASRPSRHMLHRYPIQLSDGIRFFKARLERGLRVEEAVRRRVRGYQGP